MARRKTTTTSATQAKAQTPVPAEVVSIEPVTLTGRLTADPVLRKTTSGLSVSTIRIAVNPPEGDATFHDVVTWKRTAEVVCQYLKKGRPVEVTGRPHERTWTDKDGNERVNTEINAFHVQFISRQAQAPTAERQVA